MKWPERERSLLCATFCFERAERSLAIATQSLQRVAQLAGQVDLAHDLVSYEQAAESDQSISVQKMQEGTPQFSNTPPLGAFSQPTQQHRAPEVGAVRQYGQHQQQHQQPYKQKDRLAQNQEKQRQRGNRDVSQMVLCPPERFITVPTTDLQEAFRGTLC